MNAEISNKQIEQGTRFTSMPFCGNEEALPPYEVDREIELFFSPAVKRYSERR
jgi:hypothetical protein